eukprot:TRINITY_DN8691_c0_g1_i1.p1 TRINITY_DN8691_c0_g1~~TRINITY_DN8691_c0_g1_i1.p1  ORF type:complete len:236 (+),score=71.82 TRINITY_DN8691_c0_g1_i1:83-790(+)
MDYEDEQAMEMESLEAIFLDEYEVISDSVPRKYQVKCLPCDHDDPPEGYELIDPQVFMEITYPETYPEVAPEVVLRPIQGFEVEEEEYEDDIQDCTFILETMSQVTEQIEENLGMQMAFILVQVVKDALDAHVEMTLARMNDEVHAAELKEAAEEAERKRIEMEEYDRSLGTPVTRENFMEWRKKFEIEMASTLPTFSEGKTGKQLFLEDKKIGESADLFVEETDKVFDHVPSDD